MAKKIGVDQENFLQIWWIASSTSAASIPILLSSVSTKD